MKWWITGHRFFQTRSRTQLEAPAKIHARTHGRRTTERFQRWKVLLKTYTRSKPQISWGKNSYTPISYASFLKLNEEEHRNKLRSPLLSSDLWLTALSYSFIQFHTLILKLHLSWSSLFFKTYEYFCSRICDVACFVFFYRAHVNRSIRFVSHHARFSFSFPEIRTFIASEGIL